VPEPILIDVTIVLVLGIGAQWLAWRFRLPSILLLLLAGFMAGPVIGLLSPEALQQDWLYAFVSMSIGIILFEGGLSLRISELREVGTAVRNLISVGVFITWALGAVGAYYIIGFNLSLSILVGAILVVTGPTVIVPLLRHIRPRGRVGTVAKWEGITIDPVGAVLAVLVLETILLLHEPTGAGSSAAAAATHVMEGLFLEIFISVGVSVSASALLLFMLHRRLVPDFLRNPVTLMVVVAAYETANALQHEAGLLTTTLMGIVIANQPYVSVQRIIEFKENLQVLLVGSLFVLLSARLELTALEYIDWNTLIFLGLLVLVVRPLAVVLSSIGTKPKLGWEEQTFLAWMAPRGIVAAAVASLFAFQLQDIYPQEAEALVPVVFAIVVGTVAIYGLTAAPLARWLGLADPNPQGVLFVGATDWVREVARAVKELGFPVRLIDANLDHVNDAKREGLPAECVNALAESAIDEIDWGGIGRLLIMIPNDEVGSLAALHFSEAFETTKIYQLAAHDDSRVTHGASMPKHLRGRPLFGEQTSYDSLRHCFEAGHEIKVFPITEEVAQTDLEEHLEDAFVPMFVMRNPDTLWVVSEANQFTLQPGDKLVALVDPSRLDALPVEAVDPANAGTKPVVEEGAEDETSAPEDDGADEREQEEMPVGEADAQEGTPTNRPAS
jgi:NhaP-type Na+/H+ or K+/H+ antiporter